MTVRSLIGEDAVWTNKVYSRTSDKTSSEGEAFPDLVPAGSPASSFPVREDILAVTEDETETGWRSDFATVNRWGAFSAGIHLTQVELDYSTVLEGDWIRFVYDDDDFRPDPEQRFIVLTPANINSSLSRKETTMQVYQTRCSGAAIVFPYRRARERDGFTDESLASPRFSRELAPGSRTRYLRRLAISPFPSFPDLAANETNNSRTKKSRM